MELQKEERRNDNEKKGYKKTALFSFIVSAIFLAVYIYSLNQAQKQQAPWWNNDSYYDQLTLISLLVSFTTAIIAIVSFFKYKQNTKNIIYKNIPAKVSLGIIILMFILMPRLFVLVTSQNITTALLPPVSVMEWIIIAIGIILIALGIFRKSK